MRGRPEQCRKSVGALATARKISQGPPLHEMKCSSPSPPEYSHNEHIAFQKKRIVSLPDHRAKSVMRRDKKGDRTALQRSLVAKRRVGSFTSFPPLRRV